MTVYSDIQIYKKNVVFLHWGNKKQRHTQHPSPTSPRKEQLATRCQIKKVKEQKATTSQNRRNCTIKTGVYNVQKGASAPPKHTLDLNKAVFIHSSLSSIYTKLLSFRSSKQPILPNNSASFTPPNHIFRLAIHPLSPGKTYHFTMQNDNNRPLLSFIPLSHRLFFSHSKKNFS